MIINSFQIDEALRLTPVAPERIVETAQRADVTSWLDLVDFTPDELEIFAYIDTSDWNDFLAVREDLVLRIMDIVKNAGTAFAVPARILYHGRDSGLDRERGEAAEKQVREWAAAHNLPFPDFSAEHRGQIRNTIDYPPEGSPREGEPKSEPKGTGGTPR